MGQSRGEALSAGCTDVWGAGGSQSSASGSKGAEMFLGIEPAEGHHELLWPAGAALVRTRIWPQYSREAEVVTGCFGKWHCAVAWPRGRNQ